MFTEPVIIEIHTSDRGTYKRCRRRFGWQSTLRENLVRIGPDQKAFFLGTGFHFAMEDFHGYQRFSHPALAFAAYYDAQKEADMPEEAEEALDLAVGMIEYYVEDWIVEHPESFKTLWIEGVPQVEVEIAVDITDLLAERAAYESKSVWFDEILSQYNDERRGPADGRARIQYVCTFDRVCVDSHDRIATLDYKTAASFDELNLQTNPQAGSYDWAANLFYGPVGYKPEGIIWQQHKKTVPHQPKRLAKKGLSVALDQSTTFRLYRKALREEYGEPPWPSKYDGILSILADQQDERGDRFVRREMLRRNEHQREVEQEKIVAEVLEMLDPGLPLYPNPTKDCSWDCAFKVPCLALDDGSDHEFILRTEYAKWAGYKDDWRSRVKYPDTDPSPTVLDFKE
jgi:hypothetical protein